MAIKDYLPDFKRMPADYILTSVLSMIGSALFVWFTATAANAPHFTSVGWLLIFAALAFVLVLLFACGAWAVAFARRHWRASAASPTKARTTTPTVGAKPEYIQFRLPTTWKGALGFKHQTMPADEQGGPRNEAEEVHVFMHVVNRMQNAQFEMKAMVRKGNGWETKAKIGSSVLTGTVHRT